MATQRWQATDGALFDSEPEALVHEERLRAADALGVALSTYLTGKVSDREIKYVAEDLTGVLYDNRDAILSAFWPDKVLADR